jgi:FkbM family methyltransferase
MSPPAHEVAFVHKALCQGGVALDIGASMGVMSLLMAKSGASKVHAFEPSPGTYRLLEANTALNPYISPHQLAISDQSGEIFFKDNPKASAVNHIATSVDTDDAIRVQSRMVDDFCHDNSISEIAFLKVDVEGFEPHVLRGASEALSKKLVKAGMIEIIPALLARSDSTYESLAGFLLELGYSINHIRKSGDIGPIIRKSDLGSTGRFNYAIAPIG